MRSSLRATIKGLLQPAVDTLGYTSDAYVTVKSQVNDLAGALIRFDEAPATDADRRLLRAIAALRPVAVDHDRLVRVGQDGDGGYVMLAMEPPTVALSIGIGPDASWDAEVAGRGTSVSMFDHTIRRPPTDVPGARFHRLGVGVRNEGPLRTLPALMEVSGMTPGVRAWLKMDVEGAEWPVLAGMAPDELEPFDQMVMELHDLDRLLDDARASEVLSALSAISAHHAPVHIHANNYARIVRFGRYWFPTTVEVSCVHRRLLPEPVRPATRLVSHLDRACDPRVTDIDLSALTGTIHPAE